MNFLMTIFAAEDGHAIDPARSPHWLLPEQAELIWGTFSSVVVFILLFIFLRKPVGKYFANRTATIQGELDATAADKTAAEKEAAQIRSAAGDIDAERKRLFSEADAEAAKVLEDGRARLAEEVMEIEARADAEIATSSGRVGSELAGEITRLSHRATDLAIAEGVVDSNTQQELIEAFIARVGQGVTS